jgi:hypothetical protein
LADFKFGFDPIDFGSSIVPNDFKTLDEPYDAVEPILFLEPFAAEDARMSLELLDTEDFRTSLDGILGFITSLDSENGLEFSASFDPRFCSSSREFLEFALILFVLFAGIADFDPVLLCNLTAFALFGCVVFGPGLDVLRSASDDFASFLKVDLADLESAVIESTDRESPDGGRTLTRGMSVGMDDGAGASTGGSAWVISSFCGDALISSAVKLVGLLISSS